MRLNDLLPKTYDYKGIQVSLDLSFDNVLDVFDVLKLKDELYPIEIAEMVITLLFDENVIDEEDYVEVWNDVHDEYFNPKTEEFIERDLEGNPMPTQDKGQMIDLAKDAEYIYSSFMQAYRINLFEEQNKLHWFEFKALLNGLPEETIMKQIIKIRSYEPKEGDPKEYRADMERLQNIYSLEDDAEFEEVD
ncbi:Gp15 family bacteriophage protein [Alkalibacterium sp. MB6]|uniref:Gp15 family bacteriophage protein n=1 Tax=Alkalibacterium sp. MB6 TaxID=2081965 RepID=UPI00137ADB93|nr:Gp15 family bacteriophage protein [Alkalibacterium sp. MB6]